VQSQNSTGLYQSSQELCSKGKYQEALKNITQAIQLDSFKADFFLQRAAVYFNLTKYDEAIKDCYSALKIEPDKADVYFLRGQICLITESYGGAILFFGKTIKSTQNNDLLYNAYVNRGKAYTALGKINDAHSDFLAASQINPDGQAIILLLAENYYKMNQLKEAMDELDKAKINQPDNAKIYELQGRISMEAKDYLNAIESFKRFCVLKPSDTEAQYLLAQANMESKDFTDALIAINHAITLNPIEPANFKLKGLILSEQGLEEESCNCFFKAMQLGYLEKHGYDLLDLYLQKCEDK
jgi:tetratricopeptide (TPR) repeat protein